MKLTNKKLRQLRVNGNQAMPAISSFRFFFIPISIQKFKD